jgi:signal transduction histidine kinase
MTRKLAMIALTADALRMGQVDCLAVLEGEDEPARISHSMAQLYGGLQAKNRELADMNRNLDQIVWERTKEVQRLSEETRNAAMTRERLRLSRDLHDTLAHSMLAMLTQIRLMKKLLPRRPEAMAEELEHAELAAQDGLNRARDAVLGLRYFAVRDDGLEQALLKLVRKLKERLEIDASVKVDPAAAHLSGPKAEALYRVAEEALHNVEKHAQAGNVEITVSLNQKSKQEQGLELVVEDNGKGFTPSKPKRGHFGLIGMKEQAEASGAQLSIQSQPALGTRLTLLMPL